ncbi:uncharacterized protein LOC115230026 [Octopus sinensis]|uniref:Uncharacterized protein LOC115230026 n=1 Tax=Octopus sinensis TaxID=2607531 RepID=A0A6P7U3L8_9MOLL|nr:uncharacterized protein LOC115230026 [Octopus sinensis]
MEKRKAEEEKELREIKEYHDKITKREEEERLIHFEKERKRVENIQYELEIRRHAFENKKKYIYKHEDVSTFCPHNSPIVQKESQNDKVVIEKNKQSKLLNRLEAFRTQLNEKKARLENFVDDQKVYSLILFA